MNVLIAGASGLVGSHLLNELINDEKVKKIYVITRRPLNLSQSKIEELVIDFDKLVEFPNTFDIDAVFCCLGTTIKKAKSKTKFEKVDYYYPLKIAQLAKQNGAKTYSIITAFGANKNSLFFYNKVKGRVEEALKILDYDHLQIHRPAGIMGDRNENRSGETIFNGLLNLFSPLLIGGLAKIKPVRADRIAKEMHRKALNPGNRIEIIESASYH